MTRVEGLVVKICGLRTPAAAAAAAAAGADLLGFNFAPVSRRRVAVDVAKEAIAALRSTPLPGASRAQAGEGAAGAEGRALARRAGAGAAAALTPTLSQRGRGSAPVAVGVFVNQPLAEVAEIARTCGLDALQLSGDEDAAYCRAVGSETGLPAIKALRLGGPDDERRGADYVAAGGAAALLVDAPVAGAWGGTGRAWDWSLATPLARRYPLLLAGGLTPETVAAAVAAVCPWGVDVASGVESNGLTDPAKVRDFVHRARASKPAADLAVVRPNGRRNE